MVVCGPPLGGKGPLAARLHDKLPNTIRLEALDDLSRDGAAYFPKGRFGPATEYAEAVMLREAARAWARRGENPPLILVCARFESPALRRSAAELARREQMRFMLVEAMSAPLRALHRVSGLMLPVHEMTTRLERFERAQANYQAVSVAERKRLPALTLKAVLADLDRAADRALNAWLVV